MKKIVQPLQLGATKHHRREECQHYDACLDQASALSWPSFSCNGCKLFMAKKSRSIVYDKAASPLAWDM